MKPKRWYRSKVFDPPLTSGSVLDWLIENGLVKQRCLSQAAYREYGLTHLGAQISSKIRTILGEASR